MNEERNRELEASASLGETSLWIEALAEDADTMDELEQLTEAFNAQVEWFLEESSMPVPVSARKALRSLELAREATRVALDQTRNLSAELKRLQDEELAEGLQAAFEKLANETPIGGPAQALRSHPLALGGR